ncbi:MAG: bifunctional adenosylcobinamide kinase/adenosylcobinamide-phosphate guanylyltransferase [Thermodesulfobacteriota bacterium]
MVLHGKTTLVIGGCRSGKSSYALDIAQSCEINKKKFLATSLILDQEMRDRVDKHRQERGEEWETIEVPLDMPHELWRDYDADNLLLVDCLTMWVNNMLLKDWSEDAITEAFQSLGRALQSSKARVILITNEVGTGIVPGERLSRIFRDYVGKLNQETAALADEVVWMVAGIAVNIK